MTILRRVSAMLGLAALVAALSACGGPEGPESLTALAPAAPEVEPLGQIDFIAQVAGTVDEDVDWTVLEPNGGTIDAEGTYTAPAAEGAYTVLASFRSLATTQSTAVFVKRSLRVTVSPSSATLAPGQSLSFTAAVTGDVKATTWSVAEGPAGGAVTAQGVYTAPQTPGTYRVVATSTADPSRTGAATVTVTGSTAPAPQPTPTIPTSTTTPTTTPVDPSLRTVAQWESLFLQSWESEHLNTYLPLSTSRNSWKYYNLAYGIDGLTAMFEATGNTRYLDRALLYVRNVIASAVPSTSLPNSQFKDSYLGWGAWDHPTDTSLVGGEYPLTESYCFRYVTSLLRAMRANPAVYADPAYRKTYDEVLAFTKVHIFEKWSKRGSSNLYRSRTHMAAHWAFIAADLWALTADPVERAKYRTVVDNINLHLPNYSSSLRQQLKPASADPAAYFWSDVWGSTAVPGQDVSHGNNVVAYIVEAYALGIEWTATDIRALSRTLLNHIWVPTSTGYRYGRYVDGSGDGNGWFNDGFCKLGRYDVAIQKRLETHPVGRGMQLYGNAALNAKILNGR